MQDMSRQQIEDDRMTENKCIRCGKIALILLTFKAGDSPFYLCAECTADFDRFLSGYVVHDMIKVSRRQYKDNYAKGKEANE